ncbi:MAG: 50S ribosomal protein L6 [Nanoarchaeota archaeon]
MKEKIIDKVEFPEGFEFNFEGSKVSVSKSGQHLNRIFDLKNIKLKKQGNELIIESEKATKRERKMIKTIVAHVNNMIKGLNEKFEYKLEIVYVHFPITLEHHKDKHELIIKNFLGEKKPRVCKLVPGSELEINKNIIIIKAHSKEVAGQTAANLEKATKIRKRDRRKFQDGIFIVEKNRRPI